MTIVLTLCHMTANKISSLGNEKIENKNNSDIFAILILFWISWNVVPLFIIWNLLHVNAANGVIRPTMSVNLQFPYGSFGSYLGCHVDIWCEYALGHASVDFGEYFSSRADSC